MVVAMFEMSLLPLLLVSCWVMLTRSLAARQALVPVRVRRDRNQSGR